MSGPAPSSLLTMASPAAVPTEFIWRLSIDQYHAMIRLGILTDDDPVELLEGWLVSKMPKNPPHRIATRLLRQALERLVPATTWYVDSQEPITTAESEPEPDVMVVRGETRQYGDRHPGPEDVALVVEVADATLQRDRTLKKRLYARATIPVYWIINLPERRCEVYTAPSGTATPPDYTHRQDYDMDGIIPVVLAGAEIGRIAVREIFP
jgi:Uma2 family endonuclease